MVMPVLISVSVTPGEGKIFNRDFGGNHEKV